MPKALNRPALLEPRIEADKTNAVRASTPHLVTQEGATVLRVTVTPDFAMQSRRGQTIKKLACIFQPELSCLAASWPNPRDHCA